MTVGERTPLLGTKPPLDERTPLIGGSKPPLDARVVHSCRCAVPRGLSTKVIGLLLMSLIGFGAFFCFDNPGALQTQLTHILGITNAQFGSLYAAYAWPNVVLPVIGGFLIDKLLGVRVGTIVFALFVLAGQLVFSFGGFVESLWVMVLGRFIFGLGGECLNMAINTYTVNWFQGEQLNLVFGLQLSIARLGSTLNFLVMGPLYNNVKSKQGENEAIGLSLLVASCFTLMSLICSFILGWVDRKREKLGERQDSIVEDKPIKFSDIGRLPATFWLLCLATMTYYGTIFPFISLSQNFFRKTYNFDMEQANFITGLVYLVSAVASPVFGLLIDRTGRNISWVIGAVTTSIGCHQLLTLPSVTPYIPMVLLGLAYSVLASALWSLVSLIVPQPQLATAFGIMQALQNLGTALITMGAGAIADQYGYMWLELFFSFFLCVSCISSVSIFFVDSYTTNYLNLTPTQRNARDGEIHSDTYPPPYNNNNSIRSL